MTSITSEAMPASSFSITMHKVALYATAAMPFVLLFSRAVADGLCSLVVLLFLIHSRQNRQWEWLALPLHRVMLFLWAYIVLIVPWFAHSPSRSLIEALVWGRFPLFFAASTCWVLTSREAYRIILLCTLIALGFALADTSVQFFTGTSLTGYPRMLQRLTGSLGKPNIGMYFAKMLLPAIAMGGVFIATSKQYLPWKYLALILGLISSVCLILVTGERSASILILLALILALATIFMLIPRLRWGVIAAVIVVSLGVTAVVLFSPFTQERLQMLIMQISSIHRTEYGQLWVAAFTLWKQHPVTGIGIQAFREMCPTVKNAGIVEYCNIHPHNYYLEWLSETGLIGALLFITIAVLLFNTVFRMLSQGWVMALVAGCALGTLTICFFPFSATQSFFSNWPALLNWLAITFAIASLKLPSYVRAT